MGQKWGEVVKKNWEELLSKINQLRESTRTNGLTRSGRVKEGEDSYFYSCWKYLFLGFVILFKSIMIQIFTLSIYRDGKIKELEGAKERQKEMNFF